MGAISQNNGMIGLEYSLSNYIFDTERPISEDDGFKDDDFKDFFEPNERRPQDIKEHINKCEKGIIVSTGTERSFFDLIFSDKCEGLVVRDINPKVKAYVDFNTLLLRISKTKEEYSKFSWSDITTSKSEVEEKVREIEIRIEESDVPNRMKDYYLNNINNFAEIYFKAGKIWRKSQDFSACKYHEIDEQFEKLQKYAKDGNIVSTIGTINELKFLSQLKVSVVDTSNIVEYIFLDLQIAENCFPRVIYHTFLEGSKYLSYVHAPLQPCDRKLYDTIRGKIFKTFKRESDDYKVIIEKIFKDPEVPDLSIDEIVKSYNQDEIVNSYNQKEFSHFFRDLLRHDETEDKFDNQIHAIYSPKTLTLLKNIFEPDVYPTWVKVTILGIAIMGVIGLGYILSKRPMGSS